MINDGVILKVAENLDKILKKGDINLVDKFEEEFSRLEYEKETSSIIIYGNRQLVRNAYLLLIRFYGKYADLDDFKILVSNSNERGHKMVMDFSRKMSRNPDIQIENEELCTWFLNDYYESLSGVKGSPNDYKYCLPTRYLIEKLITILNLNNYNYRRIKPEIKIYNDNLNIKDRLFESTSVTDII